MFTPKRAPKEGRTHPGLPYAGSIPTGRGRLTQRQAVVLVVVLFCFPLLYYVTHSSGTAGPSATAGRGQQVLQNGRQDGGGVLKVDVDSSGSKLVPPVEVVKDTSPPPKVAQTGSNKGTSVFPSTDEDDDEDDVPARPKKPSSDSVRKHKQSTNAEKWNERPKFETALTKVVSMLPDEVHMRELTREVDSTGKDRLREMGLRTRAYRKYFDAWEALHLSEDPEGSVHVRDDVVQYLRSHQHSSGSVDGDSEDGGLAGMTLAQTIRAYEAYRTFMVKFANLLFPWTAPYFSDHMSLHAHFKKGGRGIVLTAGDDQAPYLLTTIWSFRKLGCNLPIEVMYLGDQDLGEDYRMELEALDGVVTRDIAQMTNDEGWKLAGWAAKPFAILLSSFREVIFIDADSLFFNDPELLFEEPGYKKTGALFFKDRKIMPESKKRWLQQILPKPIPKQAKMSRFWTGESGHMQESGVVVVDKWKHFVPLLLTTRMNGPDRDGNKEQGKIGVYDMVYGDKETFWVGFLLAGDENYHFHEGQTGIMGRAIEEDGPDHLPQHERDRRKKLREAAESQQVIKEGEGQEGEGQSAESTPSQASKPDNYTICAPQLLHLDAHGQPLWFNGWLLDNKFAERSKKKFAEFKSFVIEPADVREPGAWQLAESNMCCLTSDADQKFEFKDKDMETLNMIMGRAQEIGAYGNQ